MLSHSSTEVDLPAFVLHWESGSSDLTVADGEGSGEVLDNYAMNTQFLSLYVEGLKIRLWL